MPIQMHHQKASSFNLSHPRVRNIFTPTKLHQM